jgi:CheY-like chemotaxis protein
MAEQWPAVLIVEDEKRLRFFTSEIFRLEGIPFAAVENGCLALQYLEECLSSNKALPRVIILDMMMPCMDGYQLYEKIGLEPWMNNTTVIVTSAASETMKLPDGYPTPHILYKPYEVSILVDMVREIAPDVFPQSG